MVPRKNYKYIAKAIALPAALAAKWNMLHPGQYDATTLYDNKFVQSVVDFIF